MAVRDPAGAAEARQRRPQKAALYAELLELDGGGAPVLGSRFARHLSTTELLTVLDNFVDFGD